MHFKGKQILELGYFRFAARRACLCEWQCEQARCSSHLEKTAARHCLRN